MIGRRTRPKRKKKIRDRTRYGAGKHRAADKLSRLEGREAKQMLSRYPRCERLSLESDSRCLWRDCGYVRLLKREPGPGDHGLEAVR